MKNTIACFLLGFIYSLQAQIYIDQSDLLINFEEFTAEGICNEPSLGQLNSENWSILGMSAGDVVFGNCDTSSTDFRRGISGGNVTSGGVYSFLLGGNVQGLGIQATSSDFSPGSILFRVQNISGGTLKHLRIGYDLWMNNNAGRSTFWNMYSKIGNGDFEHQLEMSDSSFTTADNLGFILCEKTILLQNIMLEDMEYLYLKWESGDIAGSGSRDEFAISNIQIEIPKNIPEERFIRSYTYSDFSLNQLNIDVSRMDKMVHYKLMDPLGNSILVDSIMDAQSLSIALPSMVNYHYLKINHKGVDQWFQFIYELNNGN